MTRPALPLPTRAAAVAVIRDSRARLEALIRRLTDEQLETAAALGGGSWSVKDLIGHLAAWEERALPWLAADDSSDLRSFPETDEFNAVEVERRAGWTLDEVRAASRQVHEQLVALIERCSDDAWCADVPIPGRDPANRGVVVGMILAGDEHGLFAHDLAHLSDVEAYVRSIETG